MLQWYHIFKNRSKNPGINHCSLEWCHVSINRSKNPRDQLTNVIRYSGYARASLKTTNMVGLFKSSTVESCLSWPDLISGSIMLLSPTVNVPVKTLHKKMYFEPFASGLEYWVWAEYMKFLAKYTPRPYTVAGKLKQCCSIYNFHSTFQCVEIKTINVFGVKTDRSYSSQNTLEAIL